MKTRLSTPAVETCYLLDPMLRKDGYGEPWPLDAPWQEIPLAPTMRGAALIIAACSHIPLALASQETARSVLLTTGEVVLRRYIVVEGQIFAGRCPTCKTVYWARP